EIRRSGEFFWERQWLRDVRPQARAQPPQAKSPELLNSCESLPRRPVEITVALYIGTGTRSRMSASTRSASSRARPSESCVDVSTMRSATVIRSEEHTSELQPLPNLVSRLLL